MNTEEEALSQRDAEQATQAAQQKTDFVRRIHEEGLQDESIKDFQTKNWPASTFQ
jgi:hypothetical protein